MGVNAPRRYRARRPRRFLGFARRRALLPLRRLRLLRGYRRPTSPRFCRSPCAQSVGTRAPVARKRHVLDGMSASCSGSRGSRRGSATAAGAFDKMDRTLGGVGSGDDDEKMCRRPYGSGSLSAIPNFGTYAVALWCAALHSVPRRESEGPSDSAVKRP